MKAKENKKAVVELSKVDSALQLLDRKRDAKVTANHIYVLSNESKQKRNDLGNGAWGAID